MMLERNGRWQEALAAAEPVIADEPSSAEALNFWGFVAADQNHELARARQRIRAALSFDPGSGAILDSLGWAHLRVGRAGPAASQFLEQAGRLEPEDPEILSHLAELYGAGASAIRRASGCARRWAHPDGQARARPAQAAGAAAARLDGSSGARSRGDAVGA